jgi:hypothetical protein
MFIRPEISLSRAEKIFCAGKSSFRLMTRLFSRKAPILPERSELVYLPFFLFDVLVEKEGKGRKNVQTNRQRVTLTVDGLLGHAVLFAEHDLEIEKSSGISAPACEFEISSSDAAKLALDQYKGILLEHGLRARVHPQAAEISEGRKIYYPFWVAYIKKKKGYDFKVLDAVSGEIQGIRMRRVFMKALRKLG